MKFQIPWPGTTAFTSPFSSLLGVEVWESHAWSTRAAIPRLQNSPWLCLGARAARIFPGVFKSMGHGAGGIRS